MRIRFSCPACERPARIEAAGPLDWQCQACQHAATLHAPVEGQLRHCLVCDNPELFKKKNFPHWLGLAILTAACLGSIIPYAMHRIGWTWIILLGSAAFDGLLYLCVGDVIECYRCGAHFHGYPANSAHQPFDLGIAERYRQERLRREQLAEAAKPL